MNDMVNVLPFGLVGDTHVTTVRLSGAERNLQQTAKFRQGGPTING